MNGGAPSGDVQTISHERLVAVLTTGLRLISDLEGDTIGAAERRARVIAAQGDLNPILLSAGEEPRTTLRLALRSLAQRPGLLRIAALETISQPGVGPDERLGLVELLAECEPIDGEVLANSLADHPLILAAPEPLQPRMQAGLVYLAGIGGSPAAVALAHRLRQSVGLDIEAAMAVLRLTASRQPSFLAACLASLYPELSREDARVTAHLRVGVPDLVRRAGAASFLEALASVPLDPLRPVVRAAFVGDKAAFCIRWAEDEEDVVIDYRLGETPHSVYARALGRGRAWHLELCSAGQLRPEPFRVIEVLKGTFSARAEEVLAHDP